MCVHLSGIEQDFETAYIDVTNSEGISMAKELFIKVGQTNKRGLLNTHFKDVVCMYLCMCVYMYVRMYACLYQHLCSMSSLRSLWHLTY